MSALRVGSRRGRAIGFRTGLAIASLVAASLPQGAVGAEPQAAAAPAESRGSQLDAPLFYELLLGEIQLRDGDAGAAYQLLLDAARRSKDEALFRRTTDIALQARAGEQALAAVVAWRQALPESQEALRFQVQLLIALNRVAEAEEPLGTLLANTPQPALPAVIAAVPRMLGRSNSPGDVAAMIERALRPFADAPETRNAALVASGRAWLAAGEPSKALTFAQRANAADAAEDGAALLALEMLPATPQAEAIVTSRLAAPDASPALRMLYVRTLAASQRIADATRQIEFLTRGQPELAPPWLTLGALELDAHHPEAATSALETYVKLVEGGAAVTMGPADAAPDNEAGGDSPSSSGNALTQAWLLLSQAAEQRGDFAAAERWLGRIDNPQRALEVQSRRASILARQGKMDEARALIRRAPEQTTADARAKLLAEVGLLRDAKNWAEAGKVMAEASAAFPDDADLLYEQAMIDEKLDRLDDMERLLRRVIELRPGHQHAYNALGYSLAERNLRLPEARALIAKALDLSPGDPFITDSLGWVEYRLGNRDEAIRLLRSAYRSRPDVEIAAHLGEVLWNAGQTDEARKVWREASTRDASNDVLRETLARLRVDL